MGIEYNGNLKNWIDKLNLFSLTLDEVVAIYEVLYNAYLYRKACLIEWDNPYLPIDTSDNFLCTVSSNELVEVLINIPTVNIALDDLEYLVKKIAGIREIKRYADKYNKSIAKLKSMVHPEPKKTSDLPW